MKLALVAALAATLLTAPAHAASASSCMPTTAAGYDAMLARVDPNQWGAGDGALNVKLPDRRVVWLFSDTMGPGSFVHSSALVQTCSTLRVPGGHTTQLLPNDTDHVIYWVNHATYAGRNSATGDYYLHVRGMQVNVEDGAWNFHETGVFSTALVTVTLAGEVRFTNWIAVDRKPAAVDPLQKNILQCELHYPDGTAVADSPPVSALCPPTPQHEYSYNPQTAPWAQPSSGKTLVAVCFSNDGPMTGNWFDYRPHFFEVSLPA